MTIMLIISILLVVSFVGTAIWKLKDIPESISSLVYVFKWKWLWTVWLVLVSVLTCAPVITVLDGIGMGVLGFGTFACLIFCAAMPVFMEDKKTWHNILGTSACILSQLCVMMICPWWLLPWLIMVVMVIAAFAGFNDNDEVPRVCDGKAIFLAQSICYISLVASLFTHGV